MQETISAAIEQLQNRAYASLDAALLYSPSDLDYLETACQAIPKSIIEIGDVGEENFLAVGRFMEDLKGQVPVYRNQPHGQQVVNLLCSGKSQEFFNGIMQGECFIRRCQSNQLEAGNFIGKHIDTYSNLEYRYSVVVQFGKDYQGGEFFIEHEGREAQFKTRYANVLINRCEIPHGVRKVQSGTRTSLVFFLSTTPLDQPNLNNKQI